MDIDQINCLLSVLDTENYSEAGERLHISQSTVSKKIIRLEKELGVKLIEKNGNHFSLSVCGKKLMPNFVELKKILLKSMIPSNHSDNPAGL
jgi:DNA-binding transcriptional LysR family regulator